jgi:hypothetical protein
MDIYEVSHFRKFGQHWAQHSSNEHFETNYYKICGIPGGPTTCQISILDQFIAT